MLLGIMLHHNTLICNQRPLAGGAHAKLTGELRSTLVFYRPDYSGQGTKASIIRLS